MTIDKVKINILASHSRACRTCRSCTKVIDHCMKIIIFALNSTGYQSPNVFNSNYVLHIHKIITSSAPEYLRLSNCISLYKPSRTLRSSQDTTRLQIPRSNYSFSANRFGVTAPKAWNNIPQHIRDMTSTPLLNSI